mgnify:CR=1 FL=1
MTFFNIIVHGVPDGQKVWSSDPLKQKGYIDAFYQTESGAPETLFQVEARVEGDERVCYYHYLKCRDIQAKGGRTGSYFGFTLRTDALCADLPLLFHHMDEVFHTALLNTVLAATPNGYQHLVADYAERNNELDTLVKEFSMWLIKPRIKELFGTLPQFPGAKQKYGIVNLEDFSAKQAVSDVLSKGYILCLSPDVPRSAYIAEKKQLQDLLNQKDAQREALLKQEQEKSRQEVATLRDKNNELSHEVARLRDNEKQLSQKVKAKEEILRLVKDFRRDMIDFLRNLAIYLGKGGAQKPENDPTPSIYSPDDGEQSEDITGDKDNKADRPFALLLKNKKATYRLLIFFLAMIIAFCLGRYFFPHMPSDRDDAVQSSWRSSYQDMNPEVGDSVAEQDSTEQAEKTPSKKAGKKHDNSENSDKKADTTNKRGKKSSERDGKSSSSGDIFGNDRSLPK